MVGREPQSRNFIRADKMRDVGAGIGGADGARARAVKRRVFHQEPRFVEVKFSLACKRNAVPRKVCRRNAVKKVYA